MSSPLPELTERLILDGTKVGWYPERVEAWKRGERIAPITIDCAMTRACNAACSFCLFPDTPILMEDGTERRIVDLLPGDRILSIGEAGESVVSTVFKVWQSRPTARGLRITTDSGKILECTAEHLVLTGTGWVQAGTLRVGDHVYECSRAESHQRADEEEQSYEAQGRGCQGDGYEAGETRQGLLQETLAANCGRGEERETHPNSRGAQGYQQTDEAEQPNEEGFSGCEGQEEAYARVPQEDVEPNEEDLAGGEDRSQHVSWQGQRQGGQQDREETVPASSSSARPVRRGRRILAASNQQRYQQEPGLHLPQRQGEDSPAGAWYVLAPGQEAEHSGDQGLPKGRLAPIRPLDQEPSTQARSTDRRAEDRILVTKGRITRIEDAGTSPVYDLECRPHHNFIAGGIVVHNCYASLQASEGAKITREQFLSFLDDAAEIGVKGVSFISDGESTVVPWYAEAVQHAHARGLAVGAGSNGIRLVPDVLAKVLPCLTYLRFNFSAGERKRYAEIMGVAQYRYDEVIENIRVAMEMVRSKGLTVNVNMQLVCDPKDADQLIPFAKLACILRPHYAIIKHCADNKEGTLGVDYNKYPALERTFDECEAMGRCVGVRITVKRGRMDGKRTYSRCYGPPFIMQLSGNGLVAPCGFLFNEKYRAFHIGNITEQRFRDIWASPRYKEVMDYLASEHFDPRVRCGPNCLQTNTNKFLYEHVHNGVPLPTVEAPPHLEFL